MKYSTVAVILLFGCNVIFCSKCPKNCKCYSALSNGTCTECNYTHINCYKAGLTEVPGEIPHSIFEIMLSNNPSLRFSHDAFLKFENLRSLKLDFNSLSDAFALPMTLKYINLRGNKFNMTAVQKIFKKKHKHLKTIFLGGDDTPFDQNFNIFPANINNLHLFHFKIRNLSGKFFQHFTKLRQLTLQSCGIETIEAGSFDHLEKLKMLDIQNNRLKALPDKLFSKCKKLNVLLLSGNQLGRLPDLSGPGYFQTLSCERCGIRNLTSADIMAKVALVLKFGRNRIENFNLTSTKYGILDLSYNNITVLNDFAFNGLRKQMRTISLINNNLTQISPKAFRGLTYIDELHLQRNNFTRLPERIFEGMTINTLLVYHSKLTTMKGVLKGMKTSPRTIALFESPNLKIVATKDFDMLGNKSSIFVDCRSLRKIVGHGNFRATIKCSSSKIIRIYTSTGILRRDGFKCTGEFSGYRGMYRCSPCGTGNYGDCLVDCPRDPCRSCPAGGFYQDEVAATSCKLCPSGQYVSPQAAPGKSPLDCQTCPSGTNTSAFASYRACRCLYGFARQSRFGECHRCDSTGIECKNDFQILKKGFWWTWHSNLTTKDEFRAFINNLQTKNDSYDRKSSNFTGLLPQPHKCPISGSCLGGLEAKCQQNYTGVFCAVCHRGYYKRFHRCIKCHSPTVASLIFLGYFALFIVVCVLISWADKMNAEEGSQRTMADIILSNLKILLGFYQVLSGIIKTLSHIRWPTTLTKTIAIFEFLQFEVLNLPSLECVKAEWRLNAVREFWLGLLIAIAFPLLVLLYFVAKKLYLHGTVTSLTSFKHRSLSCVKNCLRTIALFYFATYTITSRRVIQILPISCHRFCINEHRNGSCFMELSYMRADYGQECLSEGSDVTLRFGYAALVIPFGLPMLLLLLLHCCRMKGDKEDKDDENASKTVYMAWQDDTDILFYPHTDHRKETIGNFALKFAYENYKASCWYWEASEMARKLIMTVGFAALIQHTRVGLGGLITVAWFFAILHALRRPIKDSFENFLQLLSLCIIPLNMSIGAVLKASSIGDEDIIDVAEDSWWLGILLVMINSLIAVFVFGRLLRAVAKKLKIVCASHGSCCHNASPSCVCCVKRDQIDQLIMGINDSDFTA
eukprot:Seg1087.5 transcript_id=Seg1087.5/GoldUCD/mRNA.D3Y31 product="Leucine-rich repeat-containing protein 15" protein_id=Seg1087.5/GoldUCD/D3Y31